MENSIRHYTIPFFIPLSGCPHKCIFCDQHKITGKQNTLPESIEDKIKKYLSTLPENNSYIEIGFFGGTFTGLPIAQQEALLKPCQKFIHSGVIKSIRLSTRPDFIDKNILDLLKKYNVKNIELGIQSISDKVLQASKRGHTSKDIITASKMILANGFSLTHQLIIGLPQSSFATEYETAQHTYMLGAKEVRIYPVLVIKDTELEQLWLNGTYAPLDEKEAIIRCAKLIAYFEVHNIKVIKCGLHPSEGLLNGTEYVAGPFHPSFRQKVESFIFQTILEKYLKNLKSAEISINPKNEPFIYGFNSINKVLLKNMVIKKDLSEAEGSITISHLNKSIKLSRKTILNEILAGTVK